MASRKLIESLLLEAIQRDLLSEDNFKVFKQEVSKLLAERSRTETPDQQRPKRLKQVEQEISNILRAIKQGILTPSTKAELQKVERERDRIQEELKDHRSRLNDLALLMPKLKERFEKIVFEIPSLRAHHVDKARAILRNLLGEQIILHPCADGTERFVTAEVSGSYQGLLKLTVGKNKAGGGHPQLALFCPTIRVPLRRTSDKLTSPSNAG